MQPGSNGPPVLNGASNNYDRAVCFDAPVAMDTGLFADPNTKTLLQLREKMMIRLGYAAMLASPPPGMTQELNSFLEDAQEQLYLEYSPLRTQRWWAWQLTPGQRFYDTPIDCTKFLDTMRITFAGIADNGGVIVKRFAASTALALKAMVMPTIAGNLHFEVTTAGTTAATEPVWPTVAGATVVSGTVTFTARTPLVAQWSILHQGINRLAYGTPSGFPSHFDVGEFIEIWPTPTKPVVLWIRGHLGLKRLTLDADTPTIDSELLFLFALANAKAHRGQPDAGNYAAMARKRIARFTAMSHGLNRYIPRASTAGLKLTADMNQGPWTLPIGNWR